MKLSVDVLQILLILVFVLLDESSSFGTSSFRNCPFTSCRTRSRIAVEGIRSRALHPLSLRTRDDDDDDRESDPSRRNKNEKNYRLSRDDFEDDQDNDAYDMDEEVDRKMKSRFPNSSSAERKNKPKSKTIVKDLNKWEVVNRAVLAGVFVAGIGSGITIDSAINTNPRDLASRDAIGG